MLQVVHSYQWTVYQQNQFPVIGRNENNEYNQQS